MSILPQYRQFADVEDNVPLLKDGDKHSLMDNIESASYPPRIGGSSARKLNVTYTFNPRYPIKGDREDALGVLGSDRQTTIEIVQSAFPLLAEYSPDRIEFLTHVENASPGNPETWARILDGAWSTFDNAPPTRLMVQVADGPGDAAAREFRREQLPVIIIFGLPVLVGAVFLFVAYLCGGFE